MNYIRSIFLPRISENEEIMSIIQFPIFWITIINNLLNNGFNLNFSIKENRMLVVFILFLINITYSILIQLFIGSIGFIISYQLYYKYGAIKTGDPAFGMLKFSNGIHNHHWIYCSTGLLIYKNYFGNNSFIIGLGYGGIFHGIQFSDWYNFF